MQNLLYKEIDPQNIAYLRKYLSAMDGIIQDLVKAIFEDENIDIENISLAGLNEQIIFTL